MQQTLESRVIWRLGGRKKRERRKKIRRKKKWMRWGRRDPGKWIGGIRGSFRFFVKNYFTVAIPRGGFGGQPEFVRSWEEVGIDEVATGRGDGVDSWASGEALLGNAGWPQNSCVDVLGGLALGGGSGLGVAYAVAGV